MSRACPVCGVSVHGPVRVVLSLRPGTPPAEVEVCSAWCGRILLAKPGGYVVEVDQARG